MEAKEVLKAWLDGVRDYEEGVRLYDLYGRYRSVTELLQKKRMPDKLLESIRETYKEYKQMSAPVPIVIPATIQDESNLQKMQIAKEPVIVAEAITATKPRHIDMAILIESAQHAVVNIGDNHPVVLQLKAEWTPFYNQLGRLHSRLCIANSDEQRLVLAKELKGLHNKLVEYWHQKDYFKAHGVLPEGPKRAAKTQKQLVGSEHQRLTQARSHLSMIKNKRIPEIEAKLKIEPGNAKLLQQLADNTATKAELETEIQKLTR